MDVLKFAKRVDLFFGFVLLVAAVYCVIQHDYLMAGVWFVSAAVSFASAKFVPARWVLKRMLLARMK